MKLFVEKKGTEIRFKEIIKGSPILGIESRQDILPLNGGAERGWSSYWPNLSA